MDYFRFTALLLSIIVLLLVIDFQITTETSKIVIFKEFECYRYSTTKGGQGSHCYLIYDNGKKIYLPNVINFDENLQKGENMKVVSTGIFRFIKRIVFKNKEFTNSVKVSNLYNSFIFYGLIISFFFFLLYQFFHKRQFFQIIFGFFATLDSIVIIHYIYLH